MAGGDFTEGDFEAWLPISHAVEMAGGHLGTAIYQEIVSRLRNGLIQARAENAVVEFGARKTDLKPYAPVGTKVWDELAETRHLSALRLWRTNTVSVSLREGTYMHSPDTHYTYYGVRLDPAGVAKMLPQAAKAPAIAAVPLPIQTAEEAQKEPAASKGPPLSAKALAAWYEAYKLAYTDAERTLDHAWGHARSAFPEKSVTRAAVRALMPGGKPGPRSKS